MLKYLAIFFLCTHLMAEEVKIETQDNVKIPKEVERVLKNYWLSIFSSNYAEARKYSDLSLDFEDDHLIINSLYDSKGDIELAPRYYSRVIRKEVDNKFLLNFDFRKGAQLIKRNHYCYMLEKKEDSYTIVALISDCIQ